MDTSDDKEGEIFSPPTVSPSPQAQALETVSHPEEVIPPSVSNNVDFSYLQGSRIFLDLCSGAGHPLTSAMLQRNCICFPVDKLICADMDILNLCCVYAHLDAWVMQGPPQIAGSTAVSN